MVCLFDPGIPRAYVSEILEHSLSYFGSWKRVLIRSGVVEARRAVETAKELVEREELRSELPCQALRTWYTSQGAVLSLSSRRKQRLVSIEGIGTVTSNGFNVRRPDWVSSD